VESELGVAVGSCLGGGVWSRLLVRGGGDDHGRKSGYWERLLALDVLAERYAVNRSHDLGLKIRRWTEWEVEWHDNFKL